MKTTLTAIALFTVLATGATSVEAACNTCAPTCRVAAPTCRVAAPVCNTCAPRAVCQPMERVCTTTSCNSCDNGGGLFGFLNIFG